MTKGFLGWLPLLSLLWILIGGDGTEAQVNIFVIGDEEHPWEEWGTFEGVDHLAEPGWIQPRRTSRETNILYELYHANRLFAAFGSKGTVVDVEYKPGDARLWTPNAGFSDNQDMLRIADGSASYTRISPDSVSYTITDSVSFDFFDRRTSNNGVAIYVDLGAAYPVDEIKFYPLLAGAHQDLYMKGYELYANDGTPETLSEYGDPIYTLLDAMPTNIHAVVDNMNFPAQHMRYVKLRCTSPQSFEIDQLEIRGEGYIREATFTSKILDLGDIANFGRLRGQVVEEPGAQVSIRTRTGRDKTTMRYYKIGEVGLEELTGETDEANRSAWERLPNAAKGPVEEDTDHWSLWSVPYDSSGQAVYAEGPRQYLQIQILMRSEQATNRASMDSISFEYSQPTMARRLLGEVFPRVVDLGETATFRYKVRPTIGAHDIGFDTIEIATPVRSTVKEVRLRGSIISEEKYKVTQEHDKVRVRLSEDRVVADGDTLEVTFDSAVLAFGTVFTGRVFATWEAGLLGQLVEEEKVGNLSVQGSEASLGEILSAVGAAPNPFTPNRDGTNDRTMISFKVFQIIGDVPISVDIYDLSGRVVQSVFSALARSEQYEVPWDGTNREGELVPPGVYMYRVSVMADKGELVQVGTVGVVY